MNYFPELHIKYLNLIKDSDLEKIENRGFWSLVSLTRNLPEKFIKKYLDKLDLQIVVLYSEVSEELIKEFQDKVDWIYVSKYLEVTGRRYRSLDLPKSVLAIPVK